MSDEKACPKCSGPVWDNRATKRNPRAPDFKCRDRSCDGVIWPPREAQPQQNSVRDIITHAEAPTPQPSSQLSVDERLAILSRRMGDYEKLAARVAQLEQTVSTLQRRIEEVPF